MKILTIDIETSPHISMHWRRWQENIPQEFTLEESRMISYAAKWYGNRKVYFGAEWEDGRESMLNDIWMLLDEADVVIGFNSKRFDVKRLNTEFVLTGLQAPSPYEQVDLLHQVKKNFAFSSNRLKHVLKNLGLTPKLEDNVDMQLWREVCIDKRKAAMRRMKAYNIQDTKSTEELYDYLLGWISPHPNWGMYVDDLGGERPVCPNCGGRHLVRHKVRRTSVRRYQQWHCNDCGKYARGRKHLDSGPDASGVLMGVKA